jgi:hypothetical protein
MPGQHVLGRLLTTQTPATTDLTDSEAEEWTDQRQRIATALSEAHEPEPDQGSDLGQGVVTAVRTAEEAERSSGVGL